VVNCVNICQNSLKVDYSLTSFSGRAVLCKLRFTLVCLNLIPHAFKILAVMTYCDIDKEMKHLPGE